MSGKLANSARRSPHFHLMFDHYNRFILSGIIANIYFLIACVRHTSSPAMAKLSLEITTMISDELKEVVYQARVGQWQMFRICLSGKCKLFDQHLRPKERAESERCIRSTRKCGGDCRSCHQRRSQVGNLGFELWCRHQRLIKEHLAALFRPLPTPPENHRLVELPMLARCRAVS